MKCRQFIHSQNSEFHISVKISKHIFTSKKNPVSGFEILELARKYYTRKGQVHMVVKKKEKKSQIFAFYCSFFFVFFNVVYIARRLTDLSLLTFSMK